MPYSKGLERSSWGSAAQRPRVTVRITSGYVWTGDSIYSGYNYVFNL